MPIRDINFFKSYKNTFAKKPIQLLNNERLIIDGSWFVKKYSVDMNNLLPFHTLIDKLKDTEIVWIWNGIKPKRSFYIDFASSAILDTKKGNLQGAMKNIKKFLEFNDVKVKNYINEILRKENIKFMTAPYLAMAQAIHFQQNMSFYFFGPTDYILFEGGDKLISEFYFNNDQIEIIYKNEICRSLKYNHFKLQEFLLLFGTEFCPTIPPFSINFSGHKVHEVFGFMPIVEILNKKPDVDKEYIKKYYNAMHYIKYCPVMTDEGVRHLNSDSTNVQQANKMNLDGIFGKRLCDIFYEELFLCEIEPEILESFVYLEKKEENIFYKISLDLLDNEENLKNKENDIFTRFENLTIEKNTTENILNVLLKEKILFTDNFPLYYQIVLFYILKNNKKTTSLVLKHYVENNFEINDLELLADVLDFFKQVKYAKELIEIVKIVYNIEKKEKSVFDKNLFINNSIKFIKQNNKNRNLNELLKNLEKIK